MNQELLAPTASAINAVLGLAKKQLPHLRYDGIKVTARDLQQQLEPYKNIVVGSQPPIKLECNVDRLMRDLDIVALLEQDGITAVNAKLAELFAERKIEVVNDYLLRAIWLFPHLVSSIQITLEPLNQLRITPAETALIEELRKNYLQEFNEALSSTFTIPLPYNLESSFVLTDSYLDIEIQENALPGLGESIRIPLSQVISIQFSDSENFTKKLPSDYESTETSSLVQIPSSVQRYFAFRGLRRYDRELPCLLPDLADPYLFQLTPSIIGSWLQRGFIAPVTHQFEESRLFELHNRLAHTGPAILEKDIPRWFKQVIKNKRNLQYQGKDCIRRLMDFPVFSR